MLMGIVGDYVNGSHFLNENLNRDKEFLENECR